MITSGYEVEWIIEWPIDEHGDANPDKAVYSYRDFSTLKAARKFAREVAAPACKAGDVMIHAFHSERYEPELPATYREYDGQPEFVSV